MISPRKTIWPSQGKQTVIYAVAMGLLIVNVHFTVWRLISISADSKRVNRSYDVAMGLDDIRSSLLKAEIARNAYLSTGSNSHLKRYDAAVKTVGKSIHWLAVRIYDVPSRQNHWKAVEGEVVARLDEMDAAIRARKGGGPAAVQAQQAPDPSRMDAVERMIAAMDAEEGRMRSRLRTALNDSFWGWIYAVSALDLILLLGVQYLSTRSRRELTLSAEWFSTTLRSIGDAVVATDAAGRVSFMNRIAEELTGWEESDAVGQPLDRIFRIIDETSRKPSANPVGRVLATGTIQEISGHTILVAKDGTERPIDDSAAPIKDRSGTIRGVVMVFRDVTQEQAANSERERLYQELRETDKRKDEFLAMLAHELRNPLAAIGNAVMIGSMDDMREHLDWALDVIRRQNRHLSRLIDDLLDVSRISRGKIELRIVSVDVSAILMNAVDSVRPLIDEREHALEVSVVPGGLWAEADPTRLEQIIVNLLNNAAKYTERGGRIEVIGRIEGNSVSITVEDTGVGIPPEKLPDMFELFVQGDRSLARSEGGLGIGLTVVKKLVEMHGGSITAESAGIGRGSVFTIRIPGAYPPERTDSGPREADSSQETSRVLVVDDNVDTVLGLSKILTVRGHQVATAHSGPEALEAARKTRPEFILLDLGLPGMDGYEVARRLRREESGRAAVIIAITGYGQEADRRRSKESGFDHHLVKPLDHAALVMLLDRH